ncbi:MAG: CoA-transferase [Acidimicrobiales bacterium]|nr:CoA-transferase [Acidimicrobiales bacterium]
MVRVLEGVRVIEVSLWGFVASTGGILADWGATVSKIEHPDQGDPMRGLRMKAFDGSGEEPIQFMWEIPNRGKRGLAIDLAHPSGREALYKLVAESDVFLTSFLPGARRRLGIDVADIQAVNPKIIYVRGTGQGPKGPENEKGGFDSAMFWTRSGASLATTLDGASVPKGSPGPAFGDFTAGALLAGGVAAALFHRERTGEAKVVDLSLLGAGTWAMSPGIVSAGLFGPQPPRQFIARQEPLPNPNPVAASAYRTADDRFIFFAFLQSDRYWPQLCELIERPDLITDPRFADAEARADNSVECQTVLGDIFETKPLEQWRKILDQCEGVWTVAQDVSELLDDPQMIANGYIREIAMDNGRVVRLVASPVQFDESQPDLTRAPDHGEHTDDELLALGYTWDELIEMKMGGAIL